MEEGGFFQPVIDGLLWLFDAFYGMLVYLLSVLMILAGKLFYDISVEVIELSWSIAQDIISDLDLSSYVQSAWTGIPAGTRAILGFFRIPEVINLLMSLGVTKFMLRFIPFM